LKDPAIFFLLEQCDDEVHGDGPRILRRVKVTRVGDVLSKKTSASRFAGRQKSNWSPTGTVVSRNSDGWQFWNQPGDLVTGCKHALGIIECVATKRLALPTLP
jgi:hypothetical protein